MNIITVKINGLEYNLKGEESEEYLHKVAIYADRKIKGLSENNKKLSMTSAAVLSAVNITDELFKAVDKLKDIQGELESLKIKEIEYEAQLSDSKKHIQRLESYNDELQSRTNSVEAEKELQEKEELIASLRTEIDILKDTINKYAKENNELKEANKEIKFNLQTSKYKIMDLQSKLIDNQVTLAKERKSKNALVNCDNR